MKRFITSTLLLLTGYIATAEEFNYKAEIKTSSNHTETELIKVKIPQKLFTTLRYDFSDIFVVTDKGRSVPFNLIQDQFIKRIPFKSFYAASVRNLKLTDDSLSANINANEERIVSEIRIKTPLRDFEFNVSIYRIGGGVVVENQAIFDYSSFTESRSETISFSPIKVKSLRIVISGLSKLQKQQLFELKEFTGVTEKAKKELTSHINLQKPRFRFQMGEHRFSTKKEAVIEKVNADLIDWKIVESGKNTVIKINSHKLPINGVTISTDEKNFSRQVSIKTDTAKPYQHFLSSGTIERWNYKKFSKDETTLNFGRLRNQMIELTIHNGTDTPLTINALSFQMPSYSIYFLEEPGEKYILRYGNSNLKTSHSRLPDAIISQGRDQATVGKLEIIKHSSPVVKPEKISNTSYIIVPITILMILFLVWSIASTMKKAGISE